MRKLIIVATCILLAASQLKAQAKKETAESEATEHFMPLYIDIPTELNVRKGFQEFDLGAGYTGYSDYNAYKLLAEYDFSPMKNLGFEIEAPFNLINNKHSDDTLAEAGEHSVGGLRVGVVYSFLNLRKIGLTIAGGYYNELETRPLAKEFKEEKFLAANLYNPFITIAKVWAGNIHTMLYTGPMIHQELEGNHFSTAWKVNTSIAYRFGAKEKPNYGGIEINQSISEGDHKLETILRPQLQWSFTKALAVGFVGTIPVDMESMNGGGFIRIMYMPR